MKRLFSALLAGLLCLCLFSGCSPSPAEEGKLLVVAVNFPCYDLTRAVAGELVDLRMLIRPGMETHTFDPTPQDVRTVAACDLFLCVGGESESFVRDLLSAAENPERRVLSLMDCVEPLTEELVPGMQSEEEGDGEEYDEHVWTSPRNAVRITERIRDLLCEADAANADVYRANAAREIAELTALDGEFRAIVTSAARRTLVFGDRFPLRYFTEEYGLSYAAAFPGCAAETEASAATVAALIRTVREQEIPVIFKIELSSDRIASAISEATGARIRTFYSCHNLSAEDFEAGETYLSLMRRNLEPLREALK